MKEATTSYKSFSTILPYLGIKVEDYWHLDYELINDRVNHNYFWDLSKKYTDYNGDIDDYGVPLYLGSDGKQYHSVIFLGHYAIGAYQHFLKTKDNTSLSDFKLIADWLTDNLETKLSCEGVWVNHYPMTTFKITSEWSSCLCQAKGISTLTRAFLHFSDEKYLLAALKAATAYQLDKCKGGVKVEKNGMLFWEEYPTADSHSIVLNGHIFAIWSIYDLLSVIKGLEKFENEFGVLQKLYHQSLVDLKKGLHMWDTGSWTWYDIWDEHDNISSHFYHNLHIKQLKVLYNLTGDEVFKSYYMKWEGYESNIYYRLKALLKKVVFRIL